MQNLAPAGFWWPHFGQLIAKSLYQARRMLGGFDDNLIHADRASSDDPKDRALLAEVLESLKETPPRLPSKLFYDAAGSALFEQICRLPEYGLTRAEEEILARHAKDIVEAVGGTR